MKWEQRTSHDGYRILAVEASWDEMAADYKDMVEAYAHVRLPGFRPGKVPRGLVEQRFGKQIIDDLSQRAVHRLSHEAVREAGAEPLGPLEAVDMACKRGKPFRFSIRFRPVPDFDLPDLRTLGGREEGAQLRDAISHRLLERVRFSVPDELVRAELGEDSSNGTPERAEWRAAADRVRLLAILKRIARREGIAVDESDVSRRIDEKAVEFGSSPAALKAELEAGGGIARLRDMLLAESTLNYLVEINQ